MAGSHLRGTSASGEFPPAFIPTTQQEGQQNVTLDSVVHKVYSLDQQQQFVSNKYCAVGVERQEEMVLGISCPLTSGGGGLCGRAHAELGLIG